MKKSFTIASAILAISVFASAASAAVAEAEPALAPVVPCELMFATGAAGKGFSKMFANIKAVAPQLPICEKTSEGGLDNLSIMAQKDADVALVGVFTLQTMLSTDDQMKQFQVVASLHSNLLHAMTLSKGFDIAGPPVAGPQVKNPNYSKYNPMNKEPEMMAGPLVAGPATHVDIGKFSDLKGKIVGLVGSAALTARKLNDMSGHGMTFVDFAKDDDAIKAMRAGQIYAVFSMAAWPHGVVDKLKQTDGIKLVNYDLTPVAPFTIVRKGYKGLGQFGVQFLAEPNVLITRPFAAGGQNARNVAALKGAIAANLSKLKDGKFEPGWGEVLDMGQTYNLPAFAAGPAKK